MENGQVSAAKEASFCLDFFHRRVDLKEIDQAQGFLLKCCVFFLPIAGYLAWGT